MQNSSKFQWPAIGELSAESGRKAIRQTILEQIFSATSGHPGGSLSMVEILAGIFDGNFNHDVKQPEGPERDRLVLSKGHGVPALYSVLSYLGYFPATELKNFRKLGSFLQGHPDKSQYSLMEASTGSLGQGASVALGLALGLSLNFEAKRISRLPFVYCILGDGEIQEGQVWESLMATGKFRPKNLVFVLDHNRGQIDGPVSEVMPLEPLNKKLEAFNLDVHVCDGHDAKGLKGLFSEIRGNAVRSDKTAFVVANTLKGKGISFMEHPTKWHGAAPSREQLESAIQELFNGQSPYGRINAQT